MKIKITFLSLMAVGIASMSSAQQIENDDLYFNAKDRAKLVASRPVTLKIQAQENLEVKSPINPTDSYSARNVNPEYLAQSKMNPKDDSADAPYFIPDYTPKGVNQNLNSNSSLWNNFNYATAWNTPYYGMMPGWGSPFNSFYPYGNFYRNWYDPFGYNGFNNFYQPGWSSFWSLGFGTGWNTWGNSWAWGGSPFWNSYYYNNYMGWNSFNNWGGYGYYPNTIVVINNGSDYNGRKAVYGKRVSRSNDLSNTVTYNNRSTGNTAVVDSNGKVRGSSGRVSSGNESGGYYQKGWRTNPATNPTNSWSGSRSSGSNNSWDNTSNTRNSSGSMFQNNSRSSNWTGGNSSNFSSGGGSRSSGGISGGGSSGSRRGRD
jgi:hypothetical protein